MAQYRAGSAWQQAGGAREIGVADSKSLDLDEDFVWLDVVEPDFLKLELAVEFGDDKGGGCAGSCHVCCGDWGITRSRGLIVCMPWKKKSSVYTKKRLSQ